MHQFVRFGLCYNSSGLILKYTGTCGPLTMTKCRLFIKKGPPLNTSVVAVHLLLFYCHMLSGISPSIQLLGLFSESAKSTSVAGTEATIDISLYLEQ